MAEDFKAVYGGSVDDIESKLNKTNSISENPSDEKYPSEKAVKDYVDNNSGGGGLTEPEVDDKINSAIEDWTLNIQPESQLHKVGDIEGVDEGDAEFCYPNVLAVKNYVEAEFADAGANYGFEKQENKVESMDEASDKNVAYPTVGAVESYTESQCIVFADPLWYAVGTIEEKAFSNERKIGDIETALDGIIAIQEELIGTMTFTVGGLEGENPITYTALNGMTWEEWCDSEYNVDGYYPEDEYIFEPNSGTLICTTTIEDGEIVTWAVSPTDKIISGYAYVLG